MMKRAFGISKLLVVLHNGSLHGANRVALSFLEHLRACGIEIDIYRLGDKHCAPEIRAVGRTVTLYPEMYLGGGNFRERFERGRFRARLASGHWDAIYANTAHAAPFVAALPTGAPPVVWHIHELRFIVKHYAAYGAFQSAKARARRFIAVSPQVCDDLKEEGIPSDRIGMVPPLFRRLPSGDAGALLETLGIPAGAPVVGGCGVISWHKGSDLFTIVAQRVLRELPETRFVWLGGENEGSGDFRMQEARHDVERAGLGDRVFFPGSVPGAGAIAGLYRVFALTSRMDCWPLTMLEAAAAGVPTVCFGGAGGGELFVARGAGTAVPYLDVAAFAGAITRYLKDDSGRASAGSIAKEQIEEYAEERIVKRLASELELAVSAQSEHPG